MILLTDKILFTTESVSQGHRDKMTDQISDIQHDIDKIALESLMEICSTDDRFDINGNFIEVGD